MGRPRDDGNDKDTALTQKYVKKAAAGDGSAVQALEEIARHGGEINSTVAQQALNELRDGA